MPTIAELLASKPTIQPPAQLDFYRNAEARRPAATVTLADLIDGIRGDEYAVQVGSVRELIEAGDKPAADALKKKLPAVSVSGCLTSGGRGKAVEEGRFHHSGLLQIDLDAKDNPLWALDAMVAALKADPHIQAGFVTPSGAGVKGLARIPADPATHKQAFAVAEAYFAKRGLVIDKACKDAVRLCFVSYDPDAWLHEGPAQSFELEESDESDQSDESDSEEEDGDGGGDDAQPCFRLSGAGGLVIRGNAARELDTDTVRAMLAAIPPRPAYDEWLKIASAVWDALGEAEGTAALLAWSPEEKPGEYAAKFAKRLADVHAGTLVMRAREFGWMPEAPASVAARPARKTQDARLEDAREEEDKPAAKPRSKHDIPLSIFPVPIGDIGYEVAAAHVFAIVGPSRRLFLRGATVNEVATAANGDFEMMPVSPERFCAIVETFGPRVARREADNEGIVRWRSSTFPASAAKIVLQSDSVREHLPPIRQLVAAPILAPCRKNGARTLGKGWHDHAGGTFVSRGRTPAVVSLEDAVADILQLLADFDFPAAGDISRAVASVLSPALKLGGWIDDDFPLDIAEADKSQAGKSYRHKLICTLYGEQASGITQSVGGVGSLDERVSTALISGRPFISFDNFRGRMDSTILESAIRGYGRVAARALRAQADIDCTPFLWQLSTNGAELTRDLANRSIITRIRKRPDTHEFARYPEGDTIAHVRANQPRYLGAVHAVVRAWAQAGCPQTNENGHDFKAWCRVMDWIVQNLFGLAPLLDGHREEQLRTANPKLQYLRDILNGILADGYDGHGMSASDLADAAEEHDIHFPGKAGSSEALEVRIGKLLGRLYKEAGCGTLVVDGRKFTRQIEADYDPTTRNHRERKIYLIETENGEGKPPEKPPETEPELEIF
jgi:hypothetical protein